MAIKTRKCLSCGKSYQFCPDCRGADRLAPAWRAEFCCEDCKTLWSTATIFNMGKLTKAEAKAIILALDLKPAEQYVACIQRDLKNIMFEEPKAEPKLKRTRKVEPKLPKVAAPTIVEEVAPVMEPVPVEEIAPVAEVSCEVVNQTEEK